MALIEQTSLFSNAQQHNTATRITDIMLSSQAHLSRTLLAAMLMQLSGQTEERWLCWVADRPLKPLLDACGKDRGQRILQVVSNGGSLCNIAARALERGKSHTVAVLTNAPLSTEQRCALERAALAGDAECLVIQLQN